MVGERVQSSLVQLGGETLEGTSLPLVLSLALEQAQGVVDRSNGHAILELDNVLALDEVVTSITGLQNGGRAANALGSRGGESQRQQRENGSSLEERINRELSSRGYGRNGAS